MADDEKLACVLMELCLGATYGKTDEVWFSLRFNLHEKVFGCKHVYSPQGDHDVSLCCSLASPYTNQLKACLPEMVNRSTDTNIAIMTEFIANLRREFNCIFDGNVTNYSTAADYCQRYGFLGSTLNVLELRNSNGIPCDDEWREKLIDLLCTQNAQIAPPDDPIQMTMRG